MKTRGTLFLHGYGVRGGTWDTVRAALGTRVGLTAAPDLSAENVDELVRLARDYARELADKADGPILAVGHSLGAVLAALVALEPGSPTVTGALLIAPPYGENRDAPGPIMRFLLAKQLIPQALIRPRFFSHQTPIRIQREVFDNAVNEAPGIQELSFSKRFFHTDLFTERLPVPSMVLASEADRVAPASQSRRFGEVLGSEIEILPQSEKVGHDDFFASPDVARRTADIVADFADRID
jgi:pimeloyl-ACP methyl ester carboxylesterase